MIEYQYKSWTKEVVDSARQVDKILGSQSRQVVAYPRKMEIQVNMLRRYAYTYVMEMLDNGSDDYGLKVKEIAFTIQAVKTLIESYPVYHSQHCDLYSIMIKAQSKLESLLVQKATNH